MQTYVAGAAIATTLTAPLSNSATSFVVVSTAGWPSNLPFVISIDRGTPNEEKILVTARVGNSITACTRGYDSTTAVAHSVGTDNIEHVLSAVQLQELIDHVNEAAGGIDHTAAGLAPDSVGTSEIAADSVTSSEIAPLAVTTAELADGSVTLAKMASNSVGSTQIVDGSVAPGDLDSSLPRGKLAKTVLPTAVQSGITAEVDVTGGTVTFTAGTGRLIKVTVYTGYLQSTAGAGLNMALKEGSTYLQRFHHISVNVIITMNMFQAVIAPSAGAHTYKLTAASHAGGAVTIQNTGIGAGYNEGYILVEDIGAA